MSNSIKQSRSLYQQLILPKEYSNVKLSTSRNYHKNSNINKQDNQQASKDNSFTPQLGTGIDTGGIEQGGGTKLLGMPYKQSTNSSLITTSSTVPSSSTSSLPSIISPNYLSLNQRRCITCINKQQPGLLISPNPQPFTTLVTNLTPTNNNNNNTKENQQTWSPAQLYRKYESYSNILPSCSLLLTTQIKNNNINTIIQQGILRIRNPSSYPILFIIPKVSSSTTSATIEIIPTNTTSATNVSYITNDSYIFYIPGTIINHEDIFDIEISDLYTNIQQEFLQQEKLLKTLSALSTVNTSSALWLPSTLYPLSNQYILPGSIYHSTIIDTNIVNNRASNNKINKANFLGDINIQYTIPSSSSISSSTNSSSIHSYTIPFTYSLYIHPQILLEQGSNHNSLSSDTNNKEEKERKQLLTIRSEWII